MPEVYISIQIGLNCSLLQDCLPLVVASFMSSAGKWAPIRINYVIFDVRYQGLQSVQIFVIQQIAQRVYYTYCSYYIPTLRM